MKKPGVLKRFTLTGRLQVRLADIANRVRFRELPRMDAGDLIQSQVVRAVGPPKNREERELLCEAELLRAQLYERSGGATPLEAARALDAAFTWQMELPVDSGRSERFAKTAQELVPRLERLGSRRTVCRLVRVLLESWAEIDAPSDRVIETLSRLPDRMRRLGAVGDDPGITDLLYAAGRHRHIEGAAPLVRAVRREGLSVLLARGEPREALAVESHLRILDRDGSERLALLLADQGYFDGEARRFYRETVETWPESASRLSLSLRRLTHVDANVDGRTLEARERLSRALLPHYADEDWAYRNLAAIAASRGEAAAAVAWYAGAVDHGGEKTDLAGMVAVALCSLGFDRVAENLVATTTLGEDGAGQVIRSLAKAEKAMVEDLSASECERLVAELGDVVASRHGRDFLIARASALRGRLHLRRGRRDLAAHDLEAALSSRRHDERLAVELADCCLEFGELDRALGFVERAEQKGRSRRTLVLRADVEQAAGNLELALSALEESLVVPDRTQGPKRELRQQWDRIASSYEALGIGKAARSGFLRELRDDCRGQDARTTTHVDGIRYRAADLARLLGQSAREASLLAPLVRRPDASRRRVLRAAHAALEADDTGLASELAERLAVRRADDPATHALDGLIALRAGRAVEARRRLESAIAGGQSETSTHVALALAHAMEGDADSALRALETVDDPSIAGRLRALDFEALALERAGRHDEALVRRTEALALDDDPVRRVRFGRLAVSLALTRDAEDALLERGLEALKGADDVDSRALRALAALALGRAPQGDDLIDAMAPDPRSVEPPKALTVLRHRLVRLHLERGELDHGWRLFELLGVHDDENEIPPDLKVLMARMHLAEGGDLERVRELVGELTCSDGAVGAEARVILALTHPDQPTQNLVHDLGTCPGAAFPTMASAPLDAVRAVREAVDSGVDESALEPIITRAVDVARALGVGDEVCDRLRAAPKADFDRRIRGARQLMDDGDPDAAKSQLQDLFGRVSEERETARHVIELLHQAQEMRVRIGDDFRRRAVTQAFESGRYRDVLDWTGGLSVDPGLDLSCALLRIRALAAQSDPERATAELDALQEVVAESGETIEELTDLRASVLIATLQRALVEDGVEAQRLWRIGERRRALDELHGVCQRHPGESAPALAYAWALKAEGYTEAAESALEDARRRAGHDALDFSPVFEVTPTDIPL